MLEIQNIGYKQYGELTKEIPDDGYFVETFPNQFFANCDQYAYCWEINTMNKIRINEDGYFDFSKALIDIGCHCGTYSIVLDFAHYYMFDGNREKCIVAQFNMLLHHKFPMCQCYNVLLSDKHEEVLFDGFTTNNNNMYVDNLASNMKTKKLDDFELTNVGLIKIDAEGMENQIIKGGYGTIVRNNYPPILFELWDIGEYEMTEEKRNETIKTLEDLGYSIIFNYGFLPEDKNMHLAIHK